MPKNHKNVKLGGESVPSQARGKNQIYHFNRARITAAAFKFKLKRPQAGSYPSPQALDFDAVHHDNLARGLDHHHDLQTKLLP